MAHPLDFLDEPIPQEQEQVAPVSLNPSALDFLDAPQPEPPQAVPAVAPDTSVLNFLDEKPAAPESDKLREALGLKPSAQPAALQEQAYQKMGALEAGLYSGGLGRAYGRGIGMIPGQETTAEKVALAPYYVPKTVGEKIAYGAMDLFRRLPLFAAGKNPWIGGGLEGAGDVILNKLTEKPGAEKESVLKGGIKGTVTMGPLAFIKPAKTLLQSITTTPAKQAGVLTVANAIWDSVENGKLPNPKHLAAELGSNTLAFSVLNILARGMAKASGIKIPENKPLTQEDISRIQSAISPQNIQTQRAAPKAIANITQPEAVRPEPVTAAEVIAKESAVTPEVTPQEAAVRTAEPSTQIGGEKTAEQQAASIPSQGRPIPEVKSPELMTPEEWTKEQPKNVRNTMYELPQWPHLFDAIQRKQPINAKAWNAQSYIQTPIEEYGYVREGDRYVYKPAVPEVIKETPIADLQSQTFWELKKQAKDLGLLEKGEKATKTDLINKLEEHYAIQEQGATGIPVQKRAKSGEAMGEEVRRTEPPALPQETQEVVARTAEKIFDAEETRVREVLKPRFSRLRDLLGSQLVAEDAPIRRVLDQEIRRGNPVADRVLLKKDAIRGVPGEAARQIEGLFKDVETNVSPENDKLFSRILEARRTIEIKALDAMRGTTTKRPGGMTDVQAKAFLEDVKRKNPEQYNALIEGANKVSSSYGNLLDMYAQEGLVTPDFANKLKTEQPWYQPSKFIQYLDPEVQQTTGFGRKISVPESGIEKLSGGSEDALLNNWRYLLAQSYARGLTRIAKNQATRTLAEYAATTPENPLKVRVLASDKVPLASGETRIHWMENGQKQTMALPTSVAQYWAKQPPLLNSQIANLISWVSGKKLTQFFATGANPAFALANIPIDMGYQFLTQKGYSSVAPLALGQQAGNMATVLPDVLSGKGRVVDYIKQRGSLDTLTSQSGVGLKHPWEVARPIDESVNSVKRVLSWLGEKSELLGRLSYREQLIKNGMSPERASIEARRIIDYSQGGQLIKGIDSAVPYLNASVQAGRGIARAMKNDPALFAFKASQLVGLGAAWAYWASKRDDKAYDLISTREKEGAWVIPISTFKDADGNDRAFYLRIRKDPASRLFSATGQFLGEMWAGKEPDPRMIKMAIGDMAPVDFTTAAGIVPPVFLAIWTYARNYDFYRDKDVWQGRNVDPEFEIKPETPLFWKQVGETTGMSPARLQASAERMIPVNPYTSTMNIGYDYFNKQDDKTARTFAERLSRIPVLDRVVRTSPIVRLTEEQEKSAVKLGVDTTGKTNPQIIRELRDAERKFNNIKQVNDNKLSEFAAQIKTQQSDKTDLDKWLQLQPPLEQRRLRERIRDKYKFILGVND